MIGEINSAGLFPVKIIICNFLKMNQKRVELTKVVIIQYIGAK